jgi:hypothetical protein
VALGATAVNAEAPAAPPSAAPPATPFQPSRHPQDAWFDTLPGKHRVILDSFEGATEAMNERDKLRVLIPHWIEHNQEHAEEFRRWAEQAGDVSADILVAAEALARANDSLRVALERLGRSLPHPRDS